MSQPAPYYDRGGITVYHGDARHILPFLPQVDLLLTDPPYGIGEAAGKNKSRGCLGKSKDYGNDSWDNEPVPQWLLEQAIAKSERAIVWGGNYYELPATSCVLVWDKDNGETDFADCELAWTNLKKAVRKIKWRWQGMLQELGGDKKETRVHPTQKPLAVMKWAITMGLPAETILDPFAGSLTTARAAKDLGKRCICIEREEKYIKAGIERLRQEVLPLGA